MVADCSEPIPVPMDSPMSCCQMGASYTESDGSGICITCANTGMYIAYGLRMKLLYTCDIWSIPDLVLKQFGYTK